MPSAGNGTFSGCVITTSPARPPLRARRCGPRAAGMRLALFRVIAFDARIPSHATRYNGGAQGRAEDGPQARRGPETAPHPHGRPHGPEGAPLPRPGARHPHVRARPARGVGGLPLGSSGVPSAQEGLRVPGLGRGRLHRDGQAAPIAARGLVPAVRGAHRLRDGQERLGHRALLGTAGGARGRALPLGGRELPRSRAQETHGAARRAGLAARSRHRGPAAQARSRARKRRRTPTQ